MDEPLIVIDVEHDLDRLVDPIRFDSLLSLVQTYDEVPTLEALLVSAASLETQEERQKRAGLLVWFFGVQTLKPLAKKRKAEPLPLQGRFYTLYPKSVGDNPDAYADCIRRMCEAILKAIEAEILRD